MNERIHRFIFDFSQPLRIELRLEIKSDAKELKRLAIAASELDETTTVLQKAIDQSDQP